MSNRMAAGHFDIQSRERPAGVKGRENAAAAR